MKNRKIHNFIVQGSLLAAAGIVCRLIGMLYRLPLIDIIGTKGNGYYTSAYSIYNILLIISSYSLPTAMSRIVSERLAGERYEDVRRSLRVAFLYSTVIGALMFAVMFFGAQRIADFMNKPFLSYVLVTLAPTVWIMAYLGILRGYFQGTGNMMPTGVSQILEQVVNAIVSVVMAKLLFSYGETLVQAGGSEELKYAYGAAGGTIGTGAGALIALLFFLLIYFLYGREIISGEPEDTVTVSKVPESYKSVTKALLLTLLPILFSSFVYNANTVIDDFIFSRLMTYLGYGTSIVLLWGIFGEYRILFNIPMAIANSMSSSVLPSLTAAAARNDRELVMKKTRLGISFTIMIAVPACVGMIFLAEPICAFLFPSEQSGILINVIRLGAPAVVVCSVSTITNAILQGIGQLNKPLVHSAIGLLLHILLLIVLLFIWPGIYSVVIAHFAFGLFVCILNHSAINKYVGKGTEEIRSYIKPLAASLIMGAAAYGIYRLLFRILPAGLTANRFGVGLMLVVCIGAGLFIYLFALFLMKPYTKEELREMPMGRRLYRLARKMGLMS